MSYKFMMLAIQLGSIIHSTTIRLLDYIYIYIYISYYLINDVDL